MKDIKSRVSKLVRRYKTRDPFEIVKGMNVVLVYYPLVGIRGFYQYFKRNNIIYIDDSLLDSEKRFVLAHELGHMILHKRSNAIFMDTRTCLKTSGFELEADMFAMHLLVSDEDIHEYDGYTIEQMSRALGYRQKLIELRLKR
jgi:Zn-dependent peptidase ImmA (M78 family)